MNLIKIDFDTPTENFPSLVIDEKTLTIVKCIPDTQGNHWCGMKVNRHYFVGGYLKVQDPGIIGFKEIKYPITAITHP